MNLFVWNDDVTCKIPAIVRPATEIDFSQTKNWQTYWKSKAVSEMPNKVALCRSDNGELLGLMSYAIDEQGLAVEVIYVESAGHSNANLLKATDGKKKYIGIAKALFAYAAKISFDAGFDGVLYFRAKTSELVSYYMKELGAVSLGQYDSFRMILWEDAAQTIISNYD